MERSKVCLSVWVKAVHRLVYKLGAYCVSVVLLTLPASARATYFRFLGTAQLATKVVEYRPTKGDKTSATIICTGLSSSVPRPGAWRCTTGNVIYDPCFEAADSQGNVICASDPSRNERGVPFQSALPSGTFFSPWQQRISSARSGRT